MRILILTMTALLFISCGSSQKLIERRTQDNATVVVQKRYFSGNHYLYLEKKEGKKILLSIIYSCECRSPNKTSLHKSIVSTNGESSSWISVTDTTGKIGLFGERIDNNRLKFPTEFMPIDREEVDLIQEAVNKVDETCCRNSNKPLNKIIGYVRLK